MQMDAIAFNAVLTAGLLALQSLPLVLTPGLTIAVLTSNHDATGLESHLCRSLGLSLLASAALVLSSSGLTSSERLVIPGSSAAPSSTATTTDQPPPYASGSDDEAENAGQSLSSMPTSETAKSSTVGVVIVTTLYHIASAILSYTTYAQPSYLTGAAESGGGNAWFLLGTAGSVFAACVGGWCLIFAGSASGRSRSSGWLFPSEQSIEKRRAKRDRRLRKKLR